MFVLIVKDYCNNRVSLDSRNAAIFMLPFFVLFDVCENDGNTKSKKIFIIKKVFINNKYQLINKIWVFHKTLSNGIK